MTGPAARPQTLTGKYVECDVQIGAFENAGYPVEFREPNGTHSAYCDIDLGAQTFTSLLNSVRSVTADDEQRQTFGQYLYERVFQKRLREAWLQTKACALETGRAVRLFLQIDDPKLSPLPWELLHDDADFLATHQKVSLSRFLSFGQRPALTAYEPIRTLVVVEDTRETPVIPRIVSRLTRLIAELGHFERPVVLRNPDLRKLTEALAGPYQVLHFIGYGKADRLMLESDEEVGMDARAFALLFHDESSLQLLVLNVCDSGATSTHGVVSGVGPIIVQAGVPAVVAMQYDTISQKAAGYFNDAFYSSLGRADSLDRAVNNARRFLRSKFYGMREWSAPVLYLSSRNGGLLGAPPPDSAEAVTPIAPVPIQLRKPARQGRAARGGKRLFVERVLGDVLGSEDTEEARKARTAFYGIAYAMATETFYVTGNQRSTSSLTMEEQCGAYYQGPRDLLALTSYTLSPGARRMRSAALGNDDDPSKDYAPESWVFLRNGRRVRQLVPVAESGRKHYALPPWRQQNRLVVVTLFRNVHLFRDGSEQIWTEIRDFCGRAASVKLCLGGAIDAVEFDNVYSFPHKAPLEFRRMRSSAIAPIDARATVIDRFQPVLDYFRARAVKQTSRDQPNWRTARRLWEQVVDSTESCWTGLQLNNVCGDLLIATRGRVSGIRRDLKRRRD